jgi:hypothetical protein
LLFSAIKILSQKRTLFDLQESVRRMFGATDATRTCLVLQLVAFSVLLITHIHSSIAANASRSHEFNTTSSVCERRGVDWRNLSVFETWGIKGA